MDDSSSKRAVIGVLLLVFLFFAILMVLAFYTMSIFTTNSDNEIEIKDTKGSIAVVEVEGVIMDSKETIEKIQMAEKAKDVRAIIMRVNSPGGAVGPVQEIYEEIIRIDNDKKDGKPVYASFGTVAASGGYYIGAATRKIYSNPGTITGSIGVIMQFMDLSKLYEFAKVSPVTIKAGRYKDAGNPARAMTAEETKLMNDMMKGVHGQFIDHIVQTRKKKIKGDIVELAQGQIYSGQSAMEVGLVDEMAGLWAAGRKIHKELKLDGEFGLRFIKKKKKNNFLEILEDLEDVSSNLDFQTKFNGSSLLMFK